MVASWDEVLRMAIEANIPAILWGDPGIGKTASVEDIVQSRDGFMYLFLASQRDPVDLTGAMHPAERNGFPVTRYSMPEWVVDLNERAEAGQFCILFLDEFSTASPMMQGSVLTLIQSRKAGEYALHPDIRIVLAANPPNTAAGGYDLRAATANRLLHIDVPTNAKVWAEGIGNWARKLPDEKVDAIMRTEVLPLIAAYVNNSGIVLQVPKNESDAGRAWVSPRTWEMAARAMATAISRGAPEDLKTQLIMGAIGPGIAQEFLTYCKNLDLPDPEFLLANPDKFEVPDRQDKTFAILGQVVACVMQKTTAERNVAAWKMLADVAKANHVDLAAAHAKTLAEYLFQRGDKAKMGDISKHLLPFKPMLVKAGLIPGGK